MAQGAHKAVHVSTSTFSSLSMTGGPHFYSPTAAASSPTAAAASYLTLARLAVDAPPHLRLAPAAAASRAGVGPILLLASTGPGSQPEACADGLPKARLGGGHGSRAPRR